MYAVDEHRLIINRERRRSVRIGGHRFERVVLVAPVGEIGIGGVVQATTAAPVDREDHDQPIGILERQRPEERRIDQAEDGAVRADAERERQDRRGGEAGVLAEHAHRRNQILAECVECRDSVLIAISFLRLRRAAQADQRVPPRLVGRHARAQVVVDV